MYLGKPKMSFLLANILHKTVHYLNITSETLSISLFKFFYYWYVLIPSSLYVLYVI